jgi:hypothetical protein
MKRFGLTGSYKGDPYGYAEEYDTLDEAKKAAVYWLDRGYDAVAWDNRTGQQWTLVYRYDGLGHS